MTDTERALVLLLLWVSVVGTVSGLYNMTLLRYGGPKSIAREAALCLVIGGLAAFGAGWLG